MILYLNYLTLSLNLSVWNNCCLCSVLVHFISHAVHYVLYYIKLEVST